VHVEGYNYPSCLRLLGHTTLYATRERHRTASQHPSIKLLFLAPLNSAIFIHHQRPSRTCVMKFLQPPQATAPRPRSHTTRHVGQKEEEKRGRRRPAEEKGGACAAGKRAGRIAGEHGWIRASARYAQRYNDTAHVLTAYSGFPRPEYYDAHSIQSFQA
jgi:hypothetical protein